MQVEHSQDAVRIKRIRAQNNRSLHKQLEDQNRLERAQEVWERNWMNPEVQATLFNTYSPKLIAKILKALR